ncbi:MAG: 1-(5-phosphoribosyl)-5-[(5-phosphoribosylamino)methylideneamino]imidazole-4-carboxamide isomerase [Thermodesulfobacteriales bacterium]|nr:MAG: 1-(5-phosphoribosyl)-5-[(5-phosphoribosylamino)methylideneamino]imidazole-4-carboxamide isomerase [Thermodesulfobacteriales bacterium]
MIIIPAIDIKDGKCVRLFKGEEEKVTVFSDHPSEVAKEWEDAGAKWIHIVDLDGAFSGKPKNYNVIKSIVDSVNCPVQVGGGIRNIDTVREYVKMGFKRIILGTTAFSDQDFLRNACSEFPQEIAVGIDTKNGKIAVKGWTEVIDQTTQEVMRNLHEVGVSVVLNTNIDRDGTMEGINIDGARQFIEESPIPVIASGGIATMEDLEKLASIEHLGLYGAILGKSIYTGSINLKEAIQRYS